jgi:gliding motility-associated lipoprotein GldD
MKAFFSRVNHCLQSLVTSNLSFAVVVLIFFLISCNHDYTPKPRGYFRIEFPEKKYSLFTSANCPFSFEVPQYAEVVRDTNNLAEPCWFYINFPSLNGQIFLSYKEVKNNLNKYLEDAHTLVYKHTVRADAIGEKKIITRHHASGVFYDIGGNAASPVQFFVTDSTKNFVRGALYFNAIPNSDSIAPVAAFVKKDIEHLISTIQWK